MIVQAEYNEDSSLALHLKMLTALALLPRDDVVAGFEKLVTSRFFVANEEKLEPVVSYFEKTWIGAGTRRGNRRPPLFAISLWNHHESVKNDHARTNNSVEAWHNSFSKRCGASHLSMWKFTEALKKEQALTEAKLSQAESGEPEPKRKRIYTRLDERLKRIVVSYKKKKILSFLRGIANNVDF